MCNPNESELPDITDKQFEIMKITLGLNKRKEIVRNQFIGESKELNELVAIGLASKHSEDYLIKKPTYFLSEKAKRYTYSRFVKEYEKIDHQIKRNCQE